MKILVNYLPVYKGGGLQNAINFWLSSFKFNTNDEWICITRKGSEISLLNTDERHKIIEVNINTNHILRLFYDNIYLYSFARKYNIDVIFTLVGPGPIFRKYRKINGWHEPAFVYPDSIYWERISFKIKMMHYFKYLYAKIALKRADFISVQTNTMQTRMIKYRNIPESKICIVPNGITSFSEIDFLSKDKEELFIGLKSKIKLLVLTEPIIHKNIEYIIEMAESLDDKFVFIISFDENSNVYAKKIVNQVNIKKLNHKIIFIGRVLHKEIKKIYENIDAVFLPTILESFSANYIEAMYYKKPIFTSELDFAKEVCGNYAIYFNYLNPLSGIEKLNEFYFNGGVKNFKPIDNTLIKYPNWEERFGLYYNIIANKK